MRYAYIDKTFSAAHLEVIRQANAIAAEYAATGDDLTLRQLYYQFVARGLIPNDDKQYKRLGGILNDARLAGEFDWRYLTDVTRHVEGGDGADSDPRDIVSNLGFYAALWEGQAHRVEVWVEKDALVRVVGRAANRTRTPYFSCRGYTSVSELHVAAKRIEGYLNTEDVEDVTILHLGDHDPSGIDMTRDITRRLELFLNGDGYNSSDLTVQRIALNMDQVNTYNPPPNPAKITDSRASDYIARFGRESWELDALDPTTLRALITAQIQPLIDQGQWAIRQKFEDDGQAALTAFGEHYDRIHEFLEVEGLLPEITHDNDSDDD